MLASTRTACILESLGQQTSQLNQENEMTTTKNANAVSMLLSAISSAVTYKDDAALKSLTNAGITWANTTTDAEEKAAWKVIEVAAGWVV